MALFFSYQHHRQLSKFTISPMGQQFPVIWSQNVHFAITVHIHYFTNPGVLRRELQFKPFNLRLFSLISFIFIYFHFIVVHIHYFLFMFILFSFYFRFILVSFLLYLCFFSPFFSVLLLFVFHSAKLT